MKKDKTANTEAIIRALYQKHAGDRLQPNNMKKL